MGEIKSTLDLVMEKTKKLKLNEKEKEKLFHEENKKKAKALFQKYFINQGRLESILDELKILPEENKKEVINLLLEDILAKIDLFNDNKREFNGIAIITGASIDEIYKSYKKLYEKFISQVKKVEKKIALDIKNELSKKGISGSSVIPNVYGSKSWTKSLDSIKSSYLEELENIKKKIRDIV